MIGDRRSTDVLRSKKSSSERRRKTRLQIKPRLPVHEDIHLKKSDSSFADQIRALCSEDFSATADRMAAGAALGSIEKVIGAEVYLKDAALSLAHEQRLSGLLAELYDVADALAPCEDTDVRPVERARSAGLEEMRPALPNWWFALTEMLQTCEREIEFVASIGRGQRRNEPGRNLCNLVVRVLRRHYQEMLAEARDWIDMTHG